MVGSSGSGDEKNNLNSVKEAKLFDKVLTPTDVENFQLVISKNDGDNYFPPTQENQDDIILDFQDTNGKMLKFSYSYWDCIQIYTITKGWDDFVKDMKLKAGDTISFHRGYTFIFLDNEPEKKMEIFFIDWSNQVEVTGSSSAILSPEKKLNYFESEKKVPFFDKELTASDVRNSKIKIPKKHAMKYFPLPDQQNSRILDFQDRNGKMWRFRFTKYNEITTGWASFLKEKKLKVRDTISFYRHSIPRHDEPEKKVEIFFIDWSSQVDSAGGSSPRSRSPPAKKIRLHEEDREEPPPSG